MSRPSHQPLYRYGPVAHVWRVLGLAALAAGLLLAWLALRDGVLAPLWIALPLVAPVVVLFPMVATRMTLVDLRASERPTGASARREDLEVHVLTLAGLTRRIAVTRFVGRKYHATAQGEVSRVYAPRVWLRVQGAWPVHVDLGGTLPDRRLFASTFGVPEALR